MGSFRERRMILVALGIVIIISAYVSVRSFINILSILRGGSQVPLVPDLKKLGIKHWGIRTWL